LILLMGNFFIVFKSCFGISFCTLFRHLSFDLLPSSAKSLQF
jgi:hypothetical protein